MGDDAHLSRAVSHALRHEPWLYELELDDAGWVDLAQLVDALRKEPRWRDLSAGDVTRMVGSAPKQRHETSGGRIRARYGHSVPGEVLFEESQPPAELFHGTSREAAAVVAVEGLSPMGRQHVHLSDDLETARQVGLRKDRHPVLLVVDARAAHASGSRFFDAGPHVWLTDAVAPVHLDVVPAARPVDLGEQ